MFQLAETLNITQLMVYGLEPNARKSRVQLLMQASRVLGKFEHTL